MTDPRIIGHMELQTRAMESIAKSLRQIADKEEARSIRFAGALLDLMEIEGNECAHGYGPAAVCPEPDCAWTPLRPVMAAAAQLTTRDLGTGALDA